MLSNLQFGRTKHLIYSGKFDKDSKITKQKNLNSKVHLKKIILEKLQFLLTAKAKYSFVFQSLMK